MTGNFGRTKKRGNIHLTLLRNFPFQQYKITGIPEDIDALHLKTVLRRNAA